MREEDRVADLKKTRHARLLERPLVKPLVAACGGVLRRSDVLSVVHADNARDETLSSVGAVGVLSAFDRPWHDFELKFSSWGVHSREWDQRQMSRPGGNLVVQLNFPSDHGAMMGRHLKGGDRNHFECQHHPIRLEGRPTLAWARLDIEDDVMLIEEVQCDWLRLVRQSVRSAKVQGFRRDHERLSAYDAELSAAYGTIWPRVVMLAVLALGVDVFGVRKVYMHQPDTGAALKGIVGPRPPVSLYTALPERFGFSPTHKPPAFLKKLRKRALGKLARTQKPLFWTLSL
ncbi:MAG: hypothetical protein AAF318_04105 [Pseudomonadota bacterium]